MMERKKLISLLECSKLQLSQECKESLSSNDSIFKVHERLTNKKRYYETLFKRTKGISDASLIGVEEVLKGIINYEKSQIKLAKVSDEKCTYSIYISEDLNQIIGVMKNSKIVKSKYLDLEQKYRNCGLKGVTKWRT